MHGAFSDTVASLVQKVDHIPEMSAKQSEDIWVLLRAIQNQVSGLSAQVGSTDPISHHGPRTFDASESSKRQDDSGELHELLESIERLCQIAKQKQRTTCDMEAQTIIDDLDALLESASVQLQHRKSKSHASRKRSFDMVEEEGNIDCRELKRIRGLLAASDAMMVNQMGT